MQNYQVRRLLPVQHSTLARFYKRNQYKGKVKESDKVWVLTQIDGNVVGAVRLCQQAGFTMLRGVWIERELRAKGLGSQLLRYLQSSGELHGCYCFPYLHLEQFYARHGFRRIKSVPVALQLILERYNRHSTQVLLMTQQ
jgi:N-acetylglutamate synthase-like GNAT family acetyltransferase